jgi:hypothetical protein
MNASGMRRGEHEDDETWKKRWDKEFGREPYEWGPPWAPYLYSDYHDDTHPRVVWLRPIPRRLNYDLNWLRFGEKLPWADDGRDKDWSQWDGEIYWCHYSNSAKCGADYSERLRVWPDGEQWRWSYTYAVGDVRLRYVEGGPADKETCQRAAIDERNVWHEHLADVEVKFGPYLLQRRLLEFHRRKEVIASEEAGVVAG